MKIRAGSEVEFKTLNPITREQLREYAQASGDFNPIHLDDDVAKKVGLPGVIAHGMLVAAQMAERAKEFVKSEATFDGFQLVKFQSRFKAMTHLGDTPVVGGMVKELSEQELLLELQSRNQRGELTTQGTARFRKTK
jgi:acyl dehydratase